MNLSTFFQKFDQFADAPDAVAKLRELVLELAIKGRLVPHAPDEAPVSYESKAATPINTDEVPSNWRVVLLSDAIKNRSGNSKLIKGKLHEEPAPGLFQGFSASGADVWCDDYEHEGQAIIVSAVGARCGKAFKASGKWSAIANTNIARPEITLLDFDFAYLVLNDEHFWVRGGSAQPFVKFPPSLDRHFALPPLAEQKRIVAKVDELMALCDRLEAQQQDRESRARGLARAALARFAAAPTPANLTLLFHSSFSIPPSDLRKSILTLAVQGKLVPQDPKDEPAAEALENPSSLDSSLLADLPRNWTWARVEETGRVDLGRQRAPQHHHGPYMRPYLRVQNVYEARIDVSDVKEMNFTPAEFETFALQAGDLLLNEGQSRELVGRPAIYRGEVPGACFQNTLVRYRCFDFVLPDYALVVFRAYMRNGRFQEISKQTTNIAHLSAGRFAAMEFPLPPLAEQRRIVAKVEQAMALVDALEQQLAASRATAEKLLTALVAELTSAKTAKPRVLMAAEDPSHYDATVKVPDLTSSLELTRTVLAAEIVHRMRSDRTFGQIKFQKALYLTENLFQLSQIDSRPERYQNGPHDPELIAQVEAKMKECEWFEAVPRTGGHGHEYHALSKAGEHRKHFEKLWPKQAAAIRRLIDEMKTWKTERCERFATLYAAWNDLIHWKQPVDDAAILDQVLNHWHSAKQQIPKSSWQEMLAWMKREGYMPTGWGRETKAAPSAELFPV